MARLYESFETKSTACLKAKAYTSSGFVILSMPFMQAAKKSPL
jgi:hypothetical protein